MRVARRPVGDPVSRTEDALEGDCPTAAAGRGRPTQQGGHTLRRHATHGKPSVETTLRRDADAEHAEGAALGFGNCCGGSLRYALSARPAASQGYACLLYTSDAADEEDSVDLGGRRIIKK